VFDFPVHEYPPGAIIVLISFLVLLPGFIILPYVLVDQGRTSFSYYFNNQNSTFARLFQEISNFYLIAFIISSTSLYLLLSPVYFVDIMLTLSIIILQSIYILFILLVVFKVHLGHINVDFNKDYDIKAAASSSKVTSFIKTVFVNVFFFLLPFHLIIINFAGRFRRIIQSSPVNQYFDKKFQTDFYVGDEIYRNPFLDLFSFFLVLLIFTLIASLFIFKNKYKKLLFINPSFKRLLSIKLPNSEPSKPTKRFVVKYFKEMSFNYLVVIFSVFIMQWFFFFISYIMLPLGYIILITSSLIYEGKNRFLNYYHQFWKQLMLIPVLILSICYIISILIFAAIADFDLTIRLIFLMITHISFMVFYVLFSLFRNLKVDTLRYKIKEFPSIGSYLFIFVGNLVYLTTFFPVFFTNEHDTWIYFGLIVSILNLTFTYKVFMKIRSHIIKSSTEEIAVQQDIIELNETIFDELSNNYKFISQKTNFNWYLSFNEDIERKKTNFVILKQPLFNSKIPLTTEFRRILKLNQIKSEFNDTEVENLILNIKSQDREGHYQIFDPHIPERQLKITLSFVLTKIINPEKLYIQKSILQDLKSDQLQLLRELLDQREHEQKITLFSKL
jgi:hypothetical protein